MIAPRPEDTEDVAEAPVASADGEPDWQYEHHIEQCSHGGTLYKLDRLIAAVDKQRLYTRMSVEGQLNTQLVDLYKLADELRDAAPESGSGLTKAAVAEWLRSDEAAEVALAAICRPGAAGGMIGRASSVLDALADVVAAGSEAVR